MKQLSSRLLSWASDIEPQALEQAERSSRLPFVHGHVALMPDAHWGMGATVGSVIPTRGAIIPAAVGVDIGCGMVAVETSLRAEHLPDDLAPLHAQIARSVPAGVGQGWKEGRYPLPALGVLALTERQQAVAAKQMGSLGSGNHFVEICLDEEDYVWVVLHSGSRGVGNQLATQHIECARGLMARYFIELEDRDLAYLVEGTPEFTAYITAMLWAQDYAMLNRSVMMDAVLNQLARFLYRAPIDIEVERINCHHNFTEKEHHGSKDVWVTRKGAIRARDTDLGVIPGSMGTCSYIVRGKGNAASYNSCSHGAGRRMGRKEARRQFTAGDLADQMKGRTWNVDDAEALVDEIPSCYKDIDQVMADQKDLVEVLHTLRQIVNYKGT
jgi:RNA-splicing ligase RtcB